MRWAIFIGLACLALAIRLPRLGERPMHTDEAVNGYITGQLLAGEAYHYDPKDRHGPALYALALPIARMAGAGNLSELNETVVRLGPVIVGVVTVVGFVLLAKHIGLCAALFAALLFAIGPLPVYYSRYFIHETLFVLATLGLILSGWQLLALHREGRPVARRSFVRAGCLVGLFAALMLACKETAVLHFAAFGIAGLWWLLAARRTVGPNAWSSLALAGAAALVTFLVVLVGFYAWGGTHWQGLWDLFRSIPHLASRASGEGHEKPAAYYFKLLTDGWSGWLVIALAVFGAASRLIRCKPSAAQNEASFPIRTPTPTPTPTLTPLKKEYECECECECEEGGRRRPFQALMIYTIAIFVIYSAIPYKTPWLALNLWLPLALWAGCGFAVLWRNAKPIARALLAVGLCALIATLGHDTWLRAFAKPADERNPYAYAHTVEDLLGLPERVGELARGNPGERFSDRRRRRRSLPLPWYLRKFSQVGYWQPGQDPGAADVYITSPEAAEHLGARLENRRPEYFGVRPEALMILWPPPEKIALP